MLTLTACHTDFAAQASVRVNVLGELPYARSRVIHCCIISHVLLDPFKLRPRLTVRSIAMRSARRRSDSQPAQAFSRARTDLLRKGSASKSPTPIDGCIQHNEASDRLSLSQAGTLSAFCEPDHLATPALRVVLALCACVTFLPDI